MTPTKRTTELPPQGSVILYPYLWVSQRDRGETEGRKSRPVCLALWVQDPRENVHHLLLLAISSQPPRPDQRALEIPEIERRRGGLTRYPRAWLILSEYNYDIAERSWYLQPNVPALGAFSTPFLREIAQVLRSALVGHGAKVDRTV